MPISICGSAWTPVTQPGQARPAAPILAALILANPACAAVAALLAAGLRRPAPLDHGFAAAQALCCGLPERQHVQAAPPAPRTAPGRTDCDSARPVRPGTACRALLG